VNFLGAFLSVVARGAISLVCCLPIKVVAFLGRRCGDVMFAADGRHRRVALRNLTQCFSGTKTEREIEEIARDNFRRIGENICCAIKSTSMPDTAMGGLLQVRRSESSASVAAFRARNIIMASGHFGSFELFSRLLPHIREYRHLATYRAIRQPHLDKLLLSLRERFGMQLHERRAGAEALKKELSQGGVLLTLLADQADRANGIELNFMGRAAFTNRAPAVMAARYSCALFVPICHRVGLGQYRIEIGEPIATVLPDGGRRSCVEITADINRALEAAILRDPANWFWVHDRWKRRPVHARTPVLMEAVTA